ncbi:MAG: hypothetical protein H0W30_13485, partial [Gemmatimonadaceae bacterium]|nr:hypothetical protein [Gemmatimonadaceae bacterium]
MIKHILQRLAGGPATGHAAGPVHAVSRRGFLRAGVGGTGLLGAAALGVAGGQDASDAPGGVPPAGAHAGMHTMPGAVGEVDHAKNGFHPTNMLTDFDGGAVSTLPNGQTLREYTIVAQNKTIEVVPGVEFAAWTFNGRV